MEPEKPNFGTTRANGHDEGIRVWGIVLVAATMRSLTARPQLL